MMPRILRIKPGSLTKGWGVYARLISIAIPRSSAAVGYAVATFD